MAIVTGVELTALPYWKVLLPALPATMQEGPRPELL
jgi:hypothetical protein